MATLIETTSVRNTATFSIQPTERIRVRILYAGGTEKTLIFDHSVPSGKTLNGSVTWTGTLDPA